MCSSTQLALEARLNLGPRQLAAKRSSRKKLDRSLEALEFVRPGLAAREVGLGALIDFLRDKDLVGAGG